MESQGVSRATTGPVLLQDASGSRGHDLSNSIITAASVQGRVLAGIQQQSLFWHRFALSGYMGVSVVCV